jgi:hypothetical protein
MDQSEQLFNSAGRALEQMWFTFANFFPKLIGALVILIFGWFIAKIIATAISRLLKVIGLDSLADKAGTHELLQKAHIKKTVSEIMAQILYWVIILITASLAVEALGLTVIGESLSKLIDHVPNVFIAAILVIIGTLVANFVQDVVATAAASANMGYGSILAKMAHHLVLFFVVIIALSQLGLETYLITDNVSIIIAGIMGIAVLAVGLGGRMAAGNLIGSFYAGQMLKVGDSITIGELSGTVKSVSGVSVVLETKEHKEVIVPSHIILEEVIEKK